MLRRSVKSLVAAALVLAPALAQAQVQTATVCANQNTCSLTATASLVIPALVRLEIPGTTVSMDASTLFEINGVTTVPGAFGNVNVRANAAWDLTIAANAANWTYTGSALDASRAANTLEVIVGANAPAALSTTAASIATGAATNGTDLPVSFQAVLPADLSSTANRPGTYSLGLTLTLTAP